MSLDALTALHLAFAGPNDRCPVLELSRKGGKARTFLLVDHVAHPFVLQHLQFLVFAQQCGIDDVEALFILGQHGNCYVDAKAHMAGGHQPFDPADLIALAASFVDAWHSRRRPCLTAVPFGGKGVLNNKITTLAGVAATSAVARQGSL